MHPALKTLLAIFMVDRRSDLFLSAGGDLLVGGGENAARRFWYRARRDAGVAAVDECVSAGQQNAGRLELAYLALRKWATVRRLSRRYWQGLALGFIETCGCLVKVGLPLPVVVLVCSLLLAVFRPHLYRPFVV